MKTKIKVFDQIVEFDLDKSHQMSMFGGGGDDKKVQKPGSRGGKYYIDKKGNVIYGQRPSAKQAEKEKKLLDEIKAKKQAIKKEPEKLQQRQEPKNDAIVEKILNGKFNGKIYKDNTIYVNNEKIKISDIQKQQIAIGLLEKEVDYWIKTNKNTKFDLNKNREKFEKLLETAKKNLSIEMIDKYMKTYHIDSLKELANLIKDKIWKGYLQKTGEI